MEEIIKRFFFFQTRFKNRLYFLGFNYAHQHEKILLQPVLLYFCKVQNIRQPPRKFADK